MRLIILFLLAFLIYIPQSFAIDYTNESENEWLSKMNDESLEDVFDEFLDFMDEKFQTKLDAMEDDNSFECKIV